VKTVEMTVTRKKETPGTKAPLYLLGIILIATALRLYHLGAESLWIDEGFSLRDAARPDLLRETRPLYFLFLSQWLKVGALRSEFLLRLPSAIFGVAGVWALYAVGRRLVGASGALLASAFMAISVLHINHSEEVRWYSLVALFSLAATYFLIVSLEERRARYVVGYALSGLAMLLTFPLTVFVLAAHGLFLLLYSKAYRPTSFVLMGVLLLAMAAWIPWLLNNLVTASAYSEGYTSLIEKPTPATAIGLLGRFFLHKWSNPGRMQAAGAFGFSALVTLVALYGLKGFRRTDARTAFLWIWLVVPMAATAVMSYTIANVWKPNYLIAASPAFFLLVSRGIWMMRSRFLMATVTAVIVTLTLGRLAVYYSKPVRPEWRAAINYIEAGERPGDVIGVYSAGNQHVFRYYYRGGARWSPLGSEMVTSGRFSGWNQERVGELFSGFPVSGNRFWLVMTSHSYTGGFHIINYVKEHYRVLDHRDWFMMEIYLFDADGRPVPRERVDRGLAGR
jgi:mannosyltransferase